MFKIEMLPAANGDCLWIEYGTADAVHRILIDAGWHSTYEHLRNRILALPKDDRVFELLLITHIDSDHIEGVIPLLQDTELGCRFNDIWYNGWKHLENLPDAPAPDDVLGAREGEFIGVLLEDQQLPWNQHQVFAGGRIMVPNEGDPPVGELAGGLTLTVVSPTRLRLIELRDEWRRVADDAHFTPGDADATRAELRRRRYLPVPADQLGVEDGPPGKDNSEANGSSIAVVAEYGDVKVLLAADAFPDVLAHGLGLIGATKEKPISVDAWKLAHHGSWQNINDNLFERVRSPRYLISTNGRTFHHPHVPTIEYLIEHHPGRRKPELIFNYRTATTEAWASPDHPQAKEFTAVYPAGALLRL